MRPTTKLIYILLVTGVFSDFFSSAQEQVGPLRWNPAVHQSSLHAPKAKKTAATLSLPFFEDFNYYTPYPDSNKWTDFEVFINNTMCVSPVSWGVATFDDLNGRGIPYDSFNNSALRYADSLTSRPIDISADSVGDSLYLSFFYQAQGNGFYPQPADSLMLFFKNKFGDYILAWSAPGPALGTPVQPFQQVMVPVLDTLDFSNNFQFRFVNKASLNWADAVWNVDYIRLDKNRTLADTTIADVGFTSNPAFLLNDYTSMPYAQFKANPASEIVAQVSDSIRNDTSFGQPVNYNFIVKDGSFTLAGNPAYTSIFLPPYQTESASQPLLIGGYPGHFGNAPVTYETTFYLESNASTGPTGNDTIIKDQVFDNYLAYDDGSAEKAYYLNLFPSLPGELAIEFHLNKPDTLRGMAIYFARQIPFANYKPFYLKVYSALAGINGFPSDVLLATSSQQNPAYADSVNHFWTYLLDTPVVLPAGTFYAGTAQTENDGSDSIYYGLDVNRVGANHAYYNVLGNWSPSLISGAIMIRPIIGHAVSGSNIRSVAPATGTWSVAPNPAENYISFRFAADQEVAYSITDMTGRPVLKGNTAAGLQIDISGLPPGLYLAQLHSKGVPQPPCKIVKL